jgi:hypothetical protein
MCRAHTIRNTCAELALYKIHVQGSPYMKHVLAHTVCNVSVQLRCNSPHRQQDDIDGIAGAVAKEREQDDESYYKRCQIESL